MATITGRGLNHKDLETLLTLFKTNLNGVLVKLDADTGVADTDYNSTLAISLPAGLKADTFKDWGSVLDYFNTVRSKFNALLVKLDADGQVADTNYSALWTLTARVNNPAGGSLKYNGIGQGAIVSWLDNFMTRFDGALAKLDLDGTVNGTNFASLWKFNNAVNRYVDATGCSA